MAITCSFTFISLFLQKVNLWQRVSNRESMLCMAFTDS